MAILRRLWLVLVFNARPIQSISCPKRKQGSTQNIVPNDVVVVQNESHASCANIGYDYKTILSSCASFCSPGIPIPLGTSVLGFSQEEMDQVCLNSSFIRYDRSMMQDCKDWTSSIQDIKHKAADLMASMRNFTYEKLNFKATMTQKMADLRSELNSEATKDRIEELGEAQALKILKETIQDNIKDLLSNGISTRRLKAKMNIMETKSFALSKELDDKLSSLDDFATHCSQTFLGIGPHSEYLLDICTRLPTSCIADNVGCCCAVIPAAFHFGIDATTTQKRRLDDHFETTSGDVEACGEAYKQSDKDVKHAVEEIERTDTGANILLEFGNRQRDTYPSFYSDCNLEALPSHNHSRRLEPSNIASTHGENDIVSQASAARQLSFLNCNPPESAMIKLTPPESLKVAFTSSTRNALCKDLGDQRFYDMCERFCAPSSLPLLLGDKHAYGLNQIEMDSICLKPEQREMYSSEKVQKCIDKGKSFIVVQEKTAAFVAKLDILDAEQLLFVAKAQKASVELRRIFFEKSDDIDTASASRKVTIMKEVVKEAFEQTINDPLDLKNAIADVRSAGNDLRAVLDSSMKDLNFVLENCSGLVTGVGPNHEYLLDLCRRQGEACIQEEEADHMGCCCAFNPIANIGDRIYQSAEGVAITIDGWGARRLAEDHNVFGIDVCGEAEKTSRSNLTERKNQLVDIGYDHLWDDRARIREQMYPEYYSRCEEAAFDVSIRRRRTPSVNSTTVSSSILVSSSIAPSDSTTTTSTSTRSTGAKESYTNDGYNQGSSLKICMLSSWIILYVCDGVALMSHF